MPSSSSPEDLVRRFYREIWTGKQYDGAAEIFHSDFTYAGAPGEKGPAAKMSRIRDYHATFPDLAATVDGLVAGDGTIAAHFTITGTDLGGFRGRPATGKAITSWGVDFFDFSDGLIIGNWVGIDWLGLLVQLDVIANPWG